MNRNVVRILGGIVLFVVVGGLIGWWLTRSDSITPPPAPPITQQDTASTNVTEQPREAEPTKPEETPDVVSPPTEAAVTAANWEEHLDEILTTDKIDTDVKADKIADMIPKLPEPAQKELAEHLVNLVSDEFYAKTAKILTSETIPGSVSQVLLDDLFNRDQELMLPLTLEVAANEKHPLKDEAKELLEMVMQEDYGTNWVQWSNAVQKTLKGEEP